MKDSIEYNMAGCFHRPRLWVHVWAIISYPVRIIRHLRTVRSLDRVFSRQKELALFRSDQKLVSETSRRLLEECERQTRIEWPLRVEWVEGDVR